MKTHISRAKAYVLMAEAALSEVRREVENAETDPRMTEDQFLDVAVEARKLLKYTINQQILGVNYAETPQFAARTSLLLAKIDSILGQELIFEEGVCQTP